MIFVMFLALQEEIAMINYDKTPSDRLDLASQQAALLMQEAIAPLRQELQEAQRVDQLFYVKLGVAQERNAIAEEAALQQTQVPLATQPIEEATRRSG
jgi:hypothetical protein